MPDYNPDKEGHHKHKFIVQKGSVAPNRSSVVNSPDGRKLKMNKEGRFTVNDEKLAREIQKEAGRELIVTRVRWDDPEDRGHTYVHTVPTLPLHEKGENE